MFKPSIVKICQLSSTVFLFAELDTFSFSFCQQSFTVFASLMYNVSYNFGKSTDFYNLKINS
jgi:hypothetical protein